MNLQLPLSAHLFETLDIPENKSKTSPNFTNSTPSGQSLCINSSRFVMRHLLPAQPQSHQYPCEAAPHG